MKQTVRMALHGAVATAGLVMASGAHAAAVASQGTWDTDLVGRDLDGNTANGFEAYYDKALNITWVADGMLIKTQGLDTKDGKNDGKVTWDVAQSWVSQLNLNGITGWRLPGATQGWSSDSTYVKDKFCSYGLYSAQNCGYNPDPGNSELAHMYYVTLGNKAYYDTNGNYPQPGWGMTNTGPFQNIGSTNNYWASDYDPRYTVAWDFSTHSGYQGLAAKGDAQAVGVWAVHDGDVAAPVPEPSTYSLAACGLAVAVLFNRRQRSV